MRWSERPPAARPHYEWLGGLPCGPSSLSVAVAHLVLVRSHALLLSFVHSTAGRDFVRLRDEAVSRASDCRSREERITARHPNSHRTSRASHARPHWLGRSD